VDHPHRWPSSSISRFRRFRRRRGRAILVDRVSRGRVRSKREGERPFHLHDEVFSVVGPSGGPSKGLFGVKGTHPAPHSDLKTSESARPRNNSGYLERASVRARSASQPHSSLQPATGQPGGLYALERREELGQKAENVRMPDAL
jgi:hypothetical protein